MPASYTSDGTTSGSTTPGSTTPGSTTPGSTTPGSTTPGSTTPGSTTSETTAPPPQVWPTLRAHDARALIRFLVDAFGFEPTVVYGEGDRVDHAQLSWPPGGGVMLGSVRPDDDNWPLQPGTFGAYVVTDDLESLFARADAAGAEIVVEPQDTDYGSRDFEAVDPEGNRWRFGTYRGEPRTG